MKKLLILGLIVAIIAVFMMLDLGQYLTLEFIKSQQTELQDFYQQNSVLTILGFFVVYVIVTGASLPGALIMTLAGGAIFGLVTGVIIVSFASSIGATVAFLVSRFVLRDSVQEKFGNNLKPINDGIDKDGAFYLFALRLVPAFPFFVINMLMGLTRLKTMTFYWVSQLGMLAGTIVYVNAGTQLAQIESASGILSPKLILSFVLLAFLPFIGRKFVSIIKSSKALKAYPKPD
ncbi:MAG: TVP38/TMEM64 family protein, partial [Gammaproteobacteria bacterium]|nr:TVP38/TMEM64 family protein [Gammaproteobacteria bacterium]